MAEPPVAPIEPPGRNGSAEHTAKPGPPSLRRRLAIVGAIAFVGAWTVAIVYSVTAGGRSPERLDNATARVVEHDCAGAQHDLAALPQLTARPSREQVAARVEHEDTILTAMVAHLRTLHPSHATPATALTRWLDDWQALIVARQNFASDLRTKVRARFVEPATAGVDPIADKMNNWVLEQGTRTNTCNTDALQAEVVNGPRTYS